MIITKDTFTLEALRFIEVNKDYDREWIAQDVASSLAHQLYEELGGVKAMSLMDVDSLKSAFLTAATSLINWTRCNRKAHPDEYADLMKDGAWPNPIGGEL